MPEIKHLKKTPGEIGLETAMKLDIAKTVDTDQYSASVNASVREKGISLSQELCMIRKVVEVLCKKDETIKDLDEVKEFLDYCETVDEIKTQVKANQLQHNASAEIKED